MKPRKANWSSRKDSSAQDSHKVHSSFSTGSLYLPRPNFVKRSSKKSVHHSQLRQHQHQHRRRQRWSQSSRSPLHPWCSRRTSSHISPSFSKHQRALTPPSPRRGSERQWGFNRRFNWSRYFSCSSPWSSLPSFCSGSRSRKSGSGSRSHGFTITSGPQSTSQQQNPEVSAEPQAPSQWQSWRRRCCQKIAYVRSRLSLSLHLAQLCGGALRIKKIIKQGMKKGSFNDCHSVIYTCQGSCLMSCSFLCGCVVLLLNLFIHQTNHLFRASVLSPLSL